MGRFGRCTMRKTFYFGCDLLYIWRKTPYLTCHVKGFLYHATGLVVVIKAVARP